MDLTLLRRTLEEQEEDEEGSMDGLGEDLGDLVDSKALNEHGHSQEEEEEYLSYFLNDYVRSFWLHETRLTQELRNVTVVFVSFTGKPFFDHRDPDGADTTLHVIQNIISRTQDICSSLDGLFSNLFVDEKGCGGLLIFGLSANSGEEQHRRGVMAGVQISQVIRECGLDGGAGVTCGSVFAGLVGSSVRHDFTILGDTVNTAARLMGHAKKLPAEVGMISEDIYTYVSLPS